RFNNRFDIVTAARTIQWISEPQRAIVHMKKAAKPGGRVIVLDYNLDETHWEPDPPVDFQQFYRAFLDWRNVNNRDNRTASHLTEFFHSAGLVDIAITRVMSLFDAAIPIFSTPTHPGFGST